MDDWNVLYGGYPINQLFDLATSMSSGICRMDFANRLK